MRVIVLILLFFSMNSFSQNSKKARMLIHGGAGTILKKNMSAEKEEAIRKTLTSALQKGKECLDAGMQSIDAVEAAILILENSPLFNAGKGSVFTAEGKNEMDAAVMDGNTGKAGAVTCVRTIKNPIRAARAVMEKSEHVLLSSTGAEKFAKQQGLEFADSAYFFDAYRWEQLEKARQNEKVILDHDNTPEGKPKKDKHGTVGAVALDKNGNLAAGTSTGGMTNKKYGRIGDSPIIGAGTYAKNKTCAVSATGHGEFFIRQVVAYDISALMEYKNLSVSQAAEEVVMKKLVEIKGEGGVIALSKNGEYAMPFNTEGMYRGILFDDGSINIYIYKDEQK